MITKLSEFDVGETPVSGLMPWSTSFSIVTAQSSQGQVLLVVTSL